MRGSCASIRALPLAFAATFAAAQDASSFRQVEERARELNARTFDRSALPPALCEAVTAGLDRKVASGDVDAIVTAAQLSRDQTCRPRDFAEALRLYRLAEQRRARSARIEIALMHARGQGVPQSYSEAGRLLGVVSADDLASRDSVERGYWTCVKVVVMRAFDRAQPPKSLLQVFRGTRFVWRLDSGSGDFRLADAIRFREGFVGSSDDEDLRAAIEWQTRVLRDAIESLPTWPTQAGPAPVYEIPLTFQKNQDASTSP